MYVIEEEDSREVCVFVVDGAIAQGVVLRVEVLAANDSGKLVNHQGQ